MTDPLLQEQIDYYRARAGEYDQWFLREGRYDLGAEDNARWHTEVQHVKHELEVFGATGRVLELAGGTGFWTQYLARSAAELTVVDASQETLDLNRGRIGRGDVRYVVADIFSWEPDVAYDEVVFTFWLSHVPPELFEAFWDQVGRCLRPGGRAFFIDSRGPESTAFDHKHLRTGDISVKRTLNNGREFRIYKLFYAPDELAQQLAELGWRTRIRKTGHFFIFGEVQRAAQAQ